jgi:hypothetical protein
MKNNNFYWLLLLLPFLLGRRVCKVEAPLPSIRISAAINATQAVPPFKWAVILEESSARMAYIIKEVWFLHADIFDVKNSLFCPKNVQLFTCFVWFSEYMAIFLLNGINRFLFVKKRRRLFPVTREQIFIKIFTLNSFLIALDIDRKDFILV